MDSNVTKDKLLTPKRLVLAFQHMFAMLGATVVVPMLANMSITIALLSAGLATIFFYFVTKRKVPVFLGSSFAFLPALMALMGEAGEIGSATWNSSMLATAIAIILAGGVYVIIALIIKAVGIEKVKKFFPPIVVGPVIIVIGMTLAPKIFFNNIIAPITWNSIPAWKQWTTAIITAASIIAINSYTKPNSFFKIIPILLGFVIGYIYSAIIGLVSFEGVFSWGDIVIFQNLGKYFGFWGAFGNLDGALLAKAILMIVPMAIVTFMEHLGDIAANSAICGRDFMVDPGIHRTLIGDGVGTAIGGLLGGPANTTYGENTAVVALTKNYDARNTFLAACLAVVFGVLSVFGNIIATVPPAVIGGASVVLFGMIAASGLRALVEGKVDFTDTRNMIIVSVILSVGLGMGAMSVAGDILNNSDIYPGLKMTIGDVEISPLAVATFVGILLNIIIPHSKTQEIPQPVFMLIDNKQEEDSGKQP